MKRDLNSIQIMMRSVRTMQRIGKDSELTAPAADAYVKAAGFLRVLAVEELDKVLTDNATYTRTLAHEIADRLR